VLSEKNCSNSFRIQCLKYIRVIQVLEIILRFINTITYLYIIIILINIILGQTRLFCPLVWEIFGRVCRLCRISPKNILGNIRYSTAHHYSSSFQDELGRWLSAITEDIRSELFSSRTFQWLFKAAMQYTHPVHWIPSFVQWLKRFPYAFHNWSFFDDSFCGVLFTY